MTKVKNIKTLSDEDLFCEWKDWFTYYRNQEKLSEDDRAYFRKLCDEMKKRKLVSASIPASSVWHEENLKGASASG